MPEPLDDGEPAPVGKYALLRAARGGLGRVAVDEDTRRVIKPGNSRRSLEPELTLRSEVPSLVPAGETLYWTEDPRVAMRLDTVAPDGDGSLIAGRVSGGARFAQRLQRGVTVTLTVHNLDATDTGTCPGPIRSPTPSPTPNGPVHLEILT